MKRMAVRLSMLLLIAGIVFFTGTEFFAPFTAVYAAEEEETGEEAGQSEDLVTADTYYSDRNGGVTFCFRYKARDPEKTYTVTIGVGEVENSYKDCFYHNGKTDYMVMTYFGGVYNVKAGDTVTVRIKINDGTNDVIDENRTFNVVPIDWSVYYGTPDYSFRIDQTGQYFGREYWLEETGFTLPAGSDRSDVKEMLVVKDGKTYLGAGTTFVNKEKYDLYPDICYDRNVLGFNAELCTFANISMYNIPTPGDYDIVVRFKNRDDVTYNNCFHVTDKPVVYKKEIVEVSESTVYIALYGNGLTTESVYPEVRDAEGKAYTTCEDFAPGGEKYLYKLKKGSDWDYVENNETYIRLNGECIDTTTEADSVWYGKPYIPSLMIAKGVVYNRKKNSLEIMFNEYAEKEGTELTVKLVKDYDTVKTGKVKFKSGERVTFQLDEKIENIGSLDCVISDGVFSATNDIEDYDYNYQPDTGSVLMDAGAIDGISINISDNFSAPLKVFRVCVDVPEGTYKEGDLFAVIEETGEKLQIPYGAKNIGYESFFTDWTLGTPLMEGDYTVGIYNKGNVLLGSKHIYVRDTSKFYIINIGGGINRDDMTTAYFNVLLPSIDGSYVSNTDGYDLKLYDRDNKLIDGVTVKADTSMFGQIKYDISGLDGKTYIAYAKITKNGQLPQMFGNKEFAWSNDVPGWEIRANGTAVYTNFRSENKVLQAFYGISIQQRGAEDYVGCPAITPVTLTFFEPKYTLKTVKKVEIAYDAFTDGKYTFTQEDLSGLEKDGIYTCDISWKGRSLYGETGYFAADYVEPPEEPEVIPVTGVTITQGSEATLTISNTVETLQLEAVVTPENATNKSVSFNSSNPRVAVVDEKGLVTPVSDGDAVIKVITEDGGFSAAITIHVQIKFPVTLKKNKKTSVSGTLIFKTNGAEQKPTELFKINKSGKKASLTKVTKKGYVFKGWYTTTASGKQKKITSVTAKTLAKYPDGLVLEAKFVPGTYTVKYTITKPEKKVKVKVSPKLKAKKYKYTDENGRLNSITVEGTQLQPKDPAYKLLGWTNVKNGSEVMFKVGETVTLDRLVPEKGKTIRLYPVWGK